MFFAPDPSCAIRALVYNSTNIKGTAGARAWSSLSCTLVQSLITETQTTVFCCPFGTKSYAHIRKSNRCDPAMFTVNEKRHDLAKKL